MCEHTARCFVVLVRAVKDAVTHPVSRQTRVIAPTPVLAIRARTRGRYKKNTGVNNKEEQHRRITDSRNR